jgi:hypothetical protein
MTSIPHNNTSPPSLQPSYGHFTFFVPCLSKCPLLPPPFTSPLRFPPFTFPPLCSPSLCSHSPSPPLCFTPICVANFYYFQHSLKAPITLAPLALVAQVITPSLFHFSILIHFKLIFQYVMIFGHFLSIFYIPILHPYFISLFYTHILYSILHLNLHPNLYLPFFYSYCQYFDLQNF